MKMNRLQTFVYAVSASVVTAFSVQAAPVLYQLTVEAEFGSVAFGPAISIDSSTNQFQRYTQVVYNDAEASALDDFRWIEDARATSGSMEFLYDEEAPSAAGPTFSNCTGVLSAMCSGSVTRLDFGTGSVSSTNNLSFLTQLNEGSLRYVDDNAYTWSDGTRNFSTMGYGVTVTHNISALSVAAVPLSSSLGFLLGGLALLYGARRATRSKRAAA